MPRVRLAAIASTERESLISVYDQSMQAQPRDIQLYVTTDGKIPFSEWLGCLRDIQARAKINARLRRVSLGNLGDYRSVGGGVCEFRIDYGPGYRVYFWAEYGRRENA
jgi:putative addiction module killer protein